MLHGIELAYCTKFSAINFKLIKSNLIIMCKCKHHSLIPIPSLNAQGKPTLTHNCRDHVQAPIRCNQRFCLGTCIDYSMCFTVNQSPLCSNHMRPLVEPRCVGGRPPSPTHLIHNTYGDCLFKLPSN